VNNKGFLANVATLVSGTAIAQAITLLAIPAITFLYSACEFGLLSQYMAIVSIVGLVSSLKYEQAIVLPKAAQDAFSLAAISFASTVGVSLASLGVVTVFYDQLLAYFDQESIFIWMIPVGIFAVGSLQLVTSYSVREKKYGSIASARIANSAILCSLQVGARSLFSFNGLLLGKLLAEMFSVSLLFFVNVRGAIRRARPLSWNRMVSSAREYSTFPAHQCPTVFVNALSQNIPVLLLGFIYSSPEIVGYYAMAARLVKAPISLVSNAVKSVYYQQAAERYSAEQEIYSLYKKTTLNLIKIALLPAVIVFLFAGDALPYFLGDDWSATGQIVPPLVLWLFFGFINSPSISSYSILGIQRVQMKAELVATVFRIISLFAGSMLFDSYLMSINLFVITGIAHNCFLILYMRNKLCKNSLSA
jgi:O-antigen/teichoic acid export membrane protein